MAMLDFGVGDLPRRRLVGSPYRSPASMPPATPAANGSSTITASFSHSLHSGLHVSASASPTPTTREPRAQQHEPPVVVFLLDLPVADPEIAGLGHVTAPC